MRRDEDPQDQHIALGSSQQNKVVTRGGQIGLRNEP